MSARDRILGRARAALAPGADAEALETRRRQALARLANPEQTAPRPKIARLEGRERVERFEGEAKAAAATLSRLSRLEALPEALADELRGRNLPQAIRMGEDPALGALDWGAIETSRGPGRLEEPATLSMAAAGLAETGTLALLSGPENPVTLTFLGETHFVALRASSIEAGMEGLWARLRADGADPRTVNLVTGPSRTADIEQTIELGAHGPINLHIFLIDDL